MQQANIFNIQKFSLNDGPGIRTTVFLKGCPLRCKWCSNPESQNMDVIQEDIDNNYGTMTTQEVFDIVLQDKDFYIQSGGGLTLSGGEALLWPDFCCEIFDLAHAHNINCCMETTALAKTENFLKVLEKLDYIYIDMKHWDPDKHLEMTGVTNELIGINTCLAQKSNAELCVRIPVIPNFNDSLEDASRFAQRLKSFGIDKVQLLPFHQFGENKYKNLGLEYALKDVKPYHAEDLEDYKNTMCDLDVNAYF